MINGTSVMTGMAIKVGERMPEGTLLRMGPDGVEQVPTASVFAGRRVVVFGLPGAFTGTCSTAHVPSYMRVMASLTARGIDEVGYAVVLWSPFVPFEQVAALASSRTYALRSAFRPTYNMAANLAAIGEEIGAAQPFLKPTLFLRGGKSDYILPEDKLHGIPALFPNSQVVTVPDAGHWLHAEKPDEVFELVRNFVDHL